MDFGPVHVVPALGGLHHHYVWTAVLGWQTGNQPSFL